MPLLWDTTVALLDALPFRVPDRYWQWQPPNSPLSDVRDVSLAVATYLAIIFGGQRLMSGQKPYQLRPAFIVHNLLLSFGSLWLLALLVEQVAPIIYHHGFFYSICNKGAWTKPIITLYMVNYYFKYWELADTCFLVSKKKPLQFLHVFHHTATALLCYTQLNGRTSVSWVPITANLTVHVVMYYYYYVTSAYPGYKPWYKKALTTMQISQFVVDLFIVYFASYSYFAAVYTREWPTYGSCTGSEGAAIMGCSILTSYLFLFIHFYRKTYNPKVQSKLKALANVAVGTSGPSGTLTPSGNMTPSGRLTPDLPAVDDATSSKKGSTKADNGYLTAPGKSSRAR